MEIRSDWYFRANILYPLYMGHCKKDVELYHKFNKIMEDIKQELNSTGKIVNELV